MADDTDSTLRDLDRMALAEYAQRVRREVPGPIPWALGLLTMRIEDAVDSACATYAGQQGLAAAGRESLADKVPAKLGLADYPDGTDDDWWDIADVVYESCLSVWRSGGNADDMFAAAKKAAQASIDAAANGRCAMSNDREAAVTLVITKTMTIKPWEVADALGGEPSDDEIREYLEDAASNELGTSQMHVSFGGTESFEDAVRRECDALRSGDEQ